jgi:hypothetical protein
MVAIAQEAAADDEELVMDPETGMCMPASASTPDDDDSELSPAAPPDASSTSDGSNMAMLMQQRSTLQSSLSKQETARAARLEVVQSAMTKRKESTTISCAQPAVVVTDTNCFLDEWSLNKWEAVVAKQLFTVAVPLVGMVME